MEIGKIIKRHRELRNLSLRDLGEKAGLSPSFIGQVEREDVSPSMRSLKNITDALGIKLTELFTAIDESDFQESSPHVTPDRRRIIVDVFPGVEMYVLSPEFIESSMQAIIVNARPGGSSGEGYFTHKGEEFAYLLMGKLWVQLGDKEYILHQGDSISFNSETAHRWENKGALPSICLWVMTPPSW